MTEKQILQKVEEVSGAMIESILKMVQIDSTEAPAEPGAPFGPGVRKALDEALALSESLGFETVDVDHYMGYASYGQGEDYVCAVGHLDVVPAGTGWKEPPFSGYEKDGVIYSRGILDNKGPVFSCLYALYALKELGFEPKHPIRILFGCDEETGFQDLEYYLTKEKPPLMGFTPDCKYPVVYAERGRALVEIQPSSMERFISLMNDYVLNARNTGERFHIDYQDDEFGRLEVRNYKVLQRDIPALQFAVSYPAGCEAGELIRTVQKELPDMEVRLADNMNPVWFEKDCFLVNTLKDAYEYVTGMDGTPVTTTGGTYAKRMPGIVPFGPSFPGQKGIGHQPDEWMKIEDLITNAKIYALSLYRLAGEKEVGKETW